MTVMQLFGFNLELGGLHLRFSIGVEDQPAGAGPVRLEDLPKLELGHR